jgi:hypothetical protein
VVEIKLTRGLVAIVDDEDADLAAFKWHAAHPKYNTSYAVRTVYPDGFYGKHVSIFMHRVIADRMGLPGIVDHVSRDGLDNRRANLRSSTQSQNTANRGPQKNNTSGYKGVSFEPRYRKWTANIKVKQKAKYLGSYRTAEEAARAYDRAARETFGEFAYFNFPDEEKGAA